MAKMAKIKNEKIDLCIKHPSCRNCPRNARCEREYYEQTVDYRGLKKQNEKKKN